MSLVDAFGAAASVALMFGWVSLLIALLPTLIVASVVDAHRRQYAIAGLLGGVGGGFCGACSLFLSLWFGCHGEVQGCNTAQGDMGLLLTFPVGAFLGCIVALLCMRLYSGPRHLQNWAYMVGAQIAFWAVMIVLFARLMA